MVSATCLISFTGAVNNVDNNPDEVAPLRGVGTRILFSTIPS